MTTLHISLGELIAAIPTVLGYEPRECIVALSVNAQGLPACALTVARSTLLDPACGSITAAAIAEELATSHTQLAVLVSYTDAHVRDSCPALDALLLEVDFAVPRVEVFAVQRGRWFRPGCVEPQCCPPSGRALDAVPAALPAILAAARVDARPNASVSPRALSAAAERQSARESAADVWAFALAHGVVADAATARRLAAVLDDLCVRDWVVLTILGADALAATDALAGFESGAVGLALDRALTGGGVPDARRTANARLVVERISRAARGKKRKAATHTLAAVIEWWDGNLLESLRRCELALNSDSDYRLAALVGMAAARGIGPGWLAKVGQKAQ